MNNRILMTALVSILPMATAGAEGQRSMIFGPAVGQEQRNKVNTSTIDGDRVRLFSPKISNEKKVLVAPSVQESMNHSNDRKLLFKKRHGDLAVPAIIASKVIDVPTENQKVQVAGTRKVLFSGSEVKMDPVGGTVKLLDRKAEAVVGTRLTNRKKKEFPNESGERRPLFGPQADIGAKVLAQVNAPVASQAKGILSSTRPQVGLSTVATPELAASRASTRTKPAINPGLNAAPKLTMPALPDLVPEKVSLKAGERSSKDGMSVRKDLNTGFTRKLVIGIFADSARNKVTSDLDFLPLTNFLSTKTGVLVSPAYGFSTSVFTRQILEAKYSVVYIPSRLSSAAAAAGFVPFAKSIIVKPDVKSLIVPQEYSWWAYEENLESSVLQPFKSAVLALMVTKSAVESKVNQGHLRALGANAEFIPYSQSDLVKVKLEARSAAFKPGIDFDEGVLIENKSKSAVQPLKK